jgi:hypothetical protein
MAASIRTEVNGGIFATVAGRLDRMQRARLERLLWVDPGTRRSEFDRMKDSPQAATLGKFRDRLAHLTGLDALGPTEQWLEGIPPGKIAHFAGEARVTDAADMRKVLNDDKRLTLLISLVHECRTAARDEVVTMFCKRIAAWVWSPELAPVGLLVVTNFGPAWVVTALRSGCGVSSRILAPL